MILRVRPLWALVTSALLVTAPAAALPRVASLNLCADQYLVELADPDQITSLSPDAHDPVLSANVDKTRAFPTTRGSAEAIAALGPDIVFANLYGRAGTRSLLRGLGITVIELEVAQDFESIVRQTRIIAKAIDQEDRGEALIARMRADLVSAAPPFAGNAPTALHVQRRGFIAGSGTLIDEVMKRAGLTNLAPRLSNDAVRQVGLEQIILTRPDYLMLNTRALKAEDWGTALLQHPALIRLYPTDKRIVLEGRYTVCGSPAFPEAVRKVRAQIDKRQAHRP